MPEYTTYSIDLTGHEPLRSWPGRPSDYIDFGAGEIVRTTGAVLFDGSENWSLQSINAHGIANFLTFVPGDPFFYQMGRSNRFMPQSTVIADTTSEGFLISSNAAVYLRIKATTVNTVAAWKLWLQNNPVQFEYPMLESTREPITLPAIESLFGQTSISVVDPVGTSGLEADIRVRTS